MKLFYEIIAFYVLAVISTLKFCCFQCTKKKSHDEWILSVNPEEHCAYSLLVDVVLSVGAFHFKVFHSHFFNSNVTSLCSVDLYTSLILFGISVLYLTAKVFLSHAISSC